jgi:hypothetical protein
MENYSIKDLMKATYVTRWHTVDTVKNQSLAEHQWNVCMMSVHLALSMGLDDQTVSEIRNKALIHDMEEVWTGDLPSPYKESLKRTGGSPSHHGLGIGTPMAIPPSEAEDGPPVRSGMSHNMVIDGVVRAADLIDAWQWSQKYVLDEFVKKDCRIRMDNYASLADADLFFAMNKLTEQI